MLFRSCRTEGRFGQGYSYLFDFFFMIFTNFCLIFCRSVAFCRTVLLFVGRGGLRHFGQAVFSIFFLFNLLDVFSNLSCCIFCRPVAFVGRFL